MTTTSTTTCNLNCNNGGYCSLYPFEAKVTTTMPVDGSLRHICVCPYGYTGLTCLERTEDLDRCHHHDDTHVCRNGGVCKQVFHDNSNSNGRNQQWRCDCVIAYEVNSFAGAMCKRPATEYCNEEDSFCTNGGTCISNLVQTSTQIDTSKQCLCPPEFTGPHCEFLKVLVDNEKLPHAEKSIADKESETSEGNHGGTIGLVLGMGVFALVIIGLLVQRQRRQNRNQHLSMNDLYYMKPGFPVENQADITMDMDEDAEFILQDVTLT